MFNHTKPFEPFEELIADQIGRRSLQKMLASFSVDTDKQNKNTQVPACFLFETKCRNSHSLCRKHGEVRYDIGNKKCDRKDTNACSSCNDNGTRSHSIHSCVETYTNTQLDQSKYDLTRHDFKHLRISPSSLVLAKQTMSNELTGHSWDFQKAMLDLERSVETVLLVVSMCLLSNISCIQRTYVGLWRPNKH